MDRSAIRASRRRALIAGVRIGEANPSFCQRRQQPLEMVFTPEIVVVQLRHDRRSGSSECRVPGSGDTVIPSALNNPEALVSYRRETFGYRLVRAVVDDDHLDVGDRLSQRAGDSLHDYRR